jgi:hypothetical protein
MPGELNDEQESQNVGYYDKKYPSSGEWMKSNVESVPSEQETDSNKQLLRILNKMKKKSFN